jgi:hypothetical protein
MATGNRVSPKRSGKIERERAQARDQSATTNRTKDIRSAPRSCTGIPTDVSCFPAAIRRALAHVAFAGTDLEQWAAAAAERDYIYQIQ